MQLFSTYHPDEAAVASAAAWEYETMHGFVTEQSVTFDTFNRTRAAEVINYYVGGPPTRRINPKAAARPVAYIV